MINFLASQQQLQACLDEQIKLHEKQIAALNNALVKIRAVFEPDPPPPFDPSLSPNWNDDESFVPPPPIEPPPLPPPPKEPPPPLPYLCQVKDEPARRSNSYYIIDGQAYRSSHYFDENAHEAEAGGCRRKTNNMRYK